jgi:predicted negative regulator of RcsB-dependent stress response
MPMKYADSPCFRSGLAAVLHRLPVVAAFAATLGLVAGPAAAQIPDTFKNLRVFPKETPKQDLIDAMKGYTNALGVRCTHCHVGEEGKPLDTYDFASDAKHSKQTARLMMRMASELNTKWISQVQSDRKEHLRVTCATCHHGQPVPRSIQATLGDVMAGQGAQAAAAKYRELRQEYYGADTFDFTTGPLLQMARQEIGAKKYDNALALLDLAGEYDPKSFMVPLLQGEAHLQAGSKEKAAADYRRALELNPQSDLARKRLTDLGETVPPPPAGKTPQH